MSNVKFDTIASIEELPPVEDWVYDIEMSDQTRPYFFANGVLVHNSTYFNTYATTNDEAIRIADDVAAKVNASFPEFTRKTFLVQPSFDKMIKAGREVVSDRGIFVEKKRYILHLIDLDGKPVDKMKVMGLDTKKTTIPADVGEALTRFIERFLKGEEWSDISVDIVRYKQGISNEDDLSKIGLPKGIKGIEAYTAAHARDAKTRLPGHVSAAILYNQCLEQYADKASPAIVSGMKIRVYYLMRPVGRFTSIALPSDLEVVPPWFHENYTVDMDAHLKRLVDNPLSNILKAIGKVAPSPQSLFDESIFEY